MFGYKIEELAEGLIIGILIGAPVLGVVLELAKALVSISHLF